MALAASKPITEAAALVLMVSAPVFLLLLIRRGLASSMHVYGRGRGLVVFLLWPAAIGAAAALRIPGAFATAVAAAATYLLVAAPVWFRTGRAIHLRLSDQPREQSPVEDYRKSPASRRLRLLGVGAHIVLLLLLPVLVTLQIDPEIVLAACLAWVVLLLPLTLRERRQLRRLGIDVRLIRESEYRRHGLRPPQPAGPRERRLLRVSGLTAAGAYVVLLTSFATGSAPPDAHGSRASRAQLASMLGRIDVRQRPQGVVVYLASPDAAPDLTQIVTLFESPPQRMVNVAVTADALEALVDDGRTRREVALEHGGGRTYVSLPEASRRLRFWMARVSIPGRHLESGSFIRPNSIAD